MTFLAKREDKGVLEEQNLLDQERRKKKTDRDNRKEISEYFSKGALRDQHPNVQRKSRGDKRSRSCATSTSPQKHVRRPVAAKHDVEDSKVQRTAMPSKFLEPVHHGAARNVEKASGLVPDHSDRSTTYYSWSKSPLTRRSRPDTSSEQKQCAKKFGSSQIASPSVHLFDKRGTRKHSQAHNRGSPLSSQSTYLRTRQMLLKDPKPGTQSPHTDPHNRKRYYSLEDLHKLANIQARTVNTGNYLAEDRRQSETRQGLEKDISENTQTQAQHWKSAAPNESLQSRPVEHAPEVNVFARDCTCHFPKANVKGNAPLEPRNGDGLSSTYAMTDPELYTHRNVIAAARSNETGNSSSCHRVTHSSLNMNSQQPQFLQPIAPFRGGHGLVSPIEGVLMHRNVSSHRLLPSLFGQASSCVNLDLDRGLALPYTRPRPNNATGSWPSVQKSDQHLRYRNVEPILHVPENYPSEPIGSARHSLLTHQNYPYPFNFGPRGLHSRSPTMSQDGTGASFGIRSLDSRGLCSIAEAEGRDHFDEELMDDSIEADSADLARDMDMIDDDDIEPLNPDFGAAYSHGGLDDSNHIGEHRGADRQWPGTGQGTERPRQPVQTFEEPFAGFWRPRKLY